MLTAGAHGGVVVDNPQLGTRSALEAAPGRITLGPGHIQGALGSATPGTIVYIYNQTLGRGWTTGVSHDGSFARNLPVAPGDVVSIRLLDAFDEENRRVDLGATSVPCRATALSGCTRPRWGQPPGTSPIQRRWVLAKVHSTGLPDNVHDVWVARLEAPIGAEFAIGLTTETRSRRGHMTRPAPCR